MATVVNRTEKAFFRNRYSNQFSWYYYGNTGYSNKNVKRLLAENWKERGSLKMTHGSSG